MAAAPTAQKPIYKRIILKITGEALQIKDQSSVLNMPASERIAEEIEEIYKMGVQVAVIIGGGNIVRGRDLVNIERATADEMGMLATVINSIFLQEILEKNKNSVRMQTAIEVKGLVPFMRKKAINYLETGKIVLLAGGIGTTYCTTDFATAKRALELHADAILKGTKVEGVYKKYPPAHKEKYLKQLTYKEAANLNLGVLLDKSAINQLMEEKKAEIPIHVFDILTSGNLKRVILGEQIGTKITRVLPTATSKKEP